MAGRLINGDILLLKTYCTCDRFQLGINTYYYSIGSSTGAGITDLEVAIAMDAVARPVYRAIMYTGATYEGVTVQKIAPLPVWDFTFSHANPGAGSGAATALPTQVSGVVSRYSGFAGRAKRGRVYLPFPATDMLDTDNTPTAAYVVSAQALANAMMASTPIVGGTGTANIDPLIYHRATLTGNFVFSTLAHKKWGTQRRRGDYGQVNIDLPW